SISEKKQPSVFTFLFSPFKLPVVVAAKQVVFLDSAGAGVFHNQIQQHVAWRIALILRVITDLDRTQPLPVLQNVAERNPLARDAKEIKPQLPKIRLTLCKARVELSHGSIGNHRRAIFALPGCGFDSEAVSHCLIDLIPMSNDFYVHGTHSSKALVSLRKIETAAGSEAAKESLVIATEPDERRNRGDPFSCQPAIIGRQRLNRLNRSRRLGDLCEQNQIATVFGHQLGPDRCVQARFLVSHYEVVARRVGVVDRLDSICLETVY